MNDNRQALKCGSVISHNGREYIITGIIGRGGNAIAYTAQYYDSIIEGGIHQCVIKELFPFRQDGGIYRGEDSAIVCEPQAREFFELHRQSFLRGGKLHLDILSSSPDSVGTNLDSFETNNTVYSVLGLNSAETLASRAGKFRSLSEVLTVVIKLLKSVEVLHRNGILHLDISPSNVILSDSNGEERVLVIDFNSCRTAGIKDEDYISANPKYSAPELKLGRVSEISGATDLFSVCAVFGYLIDGGDYIYTSARLNMLARSPLLADVPQSAVSCLLNILSKGLRSNPKLRFTSVSEMLSACAELSDRIENIGVTHASLWEASRNLCGKEAEEWLDNDILANGSELHSCQLFTLGNTVLTGEGGIGKTTLFRHLWYSNTRRYIPSAPVVFYVPLHRYDGSRDFIKRYIVSKTRFGNGVSTVSDAVKRLMELMEENQPFMELMLDGWNEISTDEMDLIREIRELGSCAGVSISVSERTDTLTGEYLDTFTRVTLCPLKNEQVKQYLSSKSVAYPEDAAAARLITNPLMLTLYAKTETVFRNSGEVRSVDNTSTGIIHAYLSSLIESYKQSFPDDGDGLLRLSYAVDVLFPALCARAEKRGVLDYRSVRAVCVKDYKRLTSRSFSNAFPKYSGRVADILHGISNADEWTGAAFNRILLRDTALMTGENGVYYPLHMIFAECLAADHRQNMKRLRKAASRAHLPVVSGILTICIGSAAVTYNYLPGAHPLTGKEVQDNYYIMTNVACSVNNITMMTEIEKGVIEKIYSGDKESSLKYLYNEERKLDTLGDAAVEVEDLAERAYRGLDTEQVEKILDLSAEHREFQKIMFDRLEYALASSVYTDEDIDRELDYYKEYILEFERLTGYEVCLLTKSISSRGGSVIKESMKGSGNIVICYNNALEIRTDDLKNSINSLELKLDSLAARLGYIQGGENE